MALKVWSHMTMVALIVLVMVMILDEQHDLCHHRLVAVLLRSWIGTMSLLRSIVPLVRMMVTIVTIMLRAARW